MKQLRGKHVKKFFKNRPDRGKEIVLILENVQYAKNVAGIFRTAVGANVSKIILTGISKTPPFGKDLKKVSRGRENNVKWVYNQTTTEVIPSLKEEGFTILAIELSEEAITHSELPEYIKNKDKICFIAGNEDSGVNRTTLELCDKAVMIPMYGKGASLNVTISVGIVLFSF